MSDMPSFVDKEKFCTNYLTSLKIICDKVTAAAKKQTDDDDNVVDFSQPICLKDGDIVNGDVECDHEDSEDKYKTADLIFEFVPKATGVEVLGDIEDLPTDTLAWTPDQEYSHSISPPHASIKQPSAVVTPIPITRPTFQTPNHMSTQSDVKDPTLSGKEAVAYLCTLSAEHLRNRKLLHHCGQQAKSARKLFSESYEHVTSWSSPMPFVKVPTVESLPDMSTQQTAITMSITATTCENSITEQRLTTHLLASGSSANPRLTSVSTSQSPCSVTTLTPTHSTDLSCTQTSRRLDCVPSRSVSHCQAHTASVSISSPLIPMLDHRKSKRSLSCSPAFAAKKQRTVQKSDLSDLLLDEPLLCLSPASILKSSNV